MDSKDSEDLTAAKIAEAFPSELQPQAEIACANILRSSVGSKRCQNRFSVNLTGEKIWIPNRIYFDRLPLAFDTLDEDEKLIQQCIWTRHHSGYKRQAALAEIILSNRYWTIPFIVLLVGEYVIEILDDVHAGLDHIDEQLLGHFLAENPRFHLRTRERVVSYWDVYYRHSIRRNEYVGFKILARFQHALVAHSPELGCKRIWKRF